MINKIPSNRNFGIVFCFFFLILALYPFVFNQSQVNKTFAIISAFFLLLGIFNSKILTPFNKLWMKFGLLLNKITSPIIMLIVYIFVLTPTGLLKRIFTKNYFHINYERETNSYWLNKDKKNSNMDNQF
jgi:hypothetical protein